MTHPRHASAPARTSSSVSSSSPSPALIDSLALWAVLALRESGYSDAAIRTTFTTPHAEADAAFDAVQRAATGTVATPAAAVKAAMQRLLDVTTN